MIFAMHTRRLVLVACAGLLLAGCSSTKLVNRWHDTSFSGPPLQKLLVIGMFENEVERRYFEDEFVKQLEAGGHPAVISYDRVTDLKAHDDKAKLKAVVEAVGADSVLIAQLVAVDKEERYVPPSVDYVPSMGMGFGYYGYYHSYYQPVYRPGYKTLDTIVRIETRVFAVSTEAMVWAGNTESFNPSSAANVIRELTDAVVGDMRKSGLLK